ncbi:MAG: protein-L-isoaspartate(D-aspartate) O-methyltransferase [Formivibrio sp.]|nr:protein-L-isoaspartate(D-aspartate) O-methyltransferase [Formivibrio sp.]
MDEKQWALMRRWMLAEIAVETANLRDEIGKDHLAPQVIEVMGQVSRQMFVPTELQDRAYLNHPLPIGYGKTISQPFIVALMTDLLDIHAGETILEIGTGLGYQTAILSRLAKQVYSVEKIDGLARQAQQQLANLGYTNIEFRIGNGYDGWPEHAPFDKIIVTAAPLDTPPALFAQLKPGGLMVLPAGQPNNQQLLQLSKDTHGRPETRIILPVRFSELEADTTPSTR